MWAEAVLFSELLRCPEACLTCHSGSTVGAERTVLGAKTSGLRNEPEVSRETILQCLGETEFIPEPSCIKCRIIPATGLGWTPETEPPDCVSMTTLS